MARVTNVRVAHIRPGHADLQEADPDNVYVGRRGVVFIDGGHFPPEDSPWANPFRVGPRRWRATGPASRRGWRPTQGSGER